MESNLNYQNITDEDIILLIKQNDKEALNYLIYKYKDLVNSKVNKYFIIGAERDDIIQEGLIGLYKSIKNYKPNNQSSFKSFANLCIERQLITAIKSSNRQKHMPLNSYVSLNMPAYDNDTIGEDEGIQVMEVIDNSMAEDPLDTITKKEYMEFVTNTIDNSLSSFERQVLDRYVQGESYVEIAEKLESPVKSVDNAIQRIRKKTMKNLGNENM